MLIASKNIFYYLDFTSINHPIHIVNKDNDISPSAFIPFCEFGGNMSAMGLKIAEFDIPVCNSFKAEILNDQLCYKVDLNMFKDVNNVERELKLGFYFLMDFNEDRQVTFDKNTVENKEFDLASNVIESDQDDQAFIYLDTIGKKNFVIA